MGDIQNQNIKKSFRKLLQSIGMDIKLGQNSFSNFMMLTQIYTFTSTQIRKNYLYIHC